MQIALVHRWFIVALLAVACVLQTPRAACAQEPCQGDVDGDGVVTAADVDALIPLFFAEPGEIDLATADANDDGAVSAGDIVAILLQDGLPCPAVPTPTPTLPPTPAATSTPSGTPTRTRTPPPTPTPTQTCVVQPIQPGDDIDGALTTGDCQRAFRGSVRYTDAYTIQHSAQGYEAIKVDVTAPSGAIVPFLQVNDADGQFGVVSGSPPIEFVVMSADPYEILVTSSPTTETQLGSYQLTVTTRACPARAINPGARLGRLDGTECPDPALPAINNDIDLADFYTFEVAEPLTYVEITMRQSVEESDMEPVFVVIGPDGYEVVTADQSVDAAPSFFLLEAQARFLARQPGTYTIIATGEFCDPSDPDANCRYSLNLSFSGCRATPLNDIPSSGPLSIQGTLYGDINRTGCATPLPLVTVFDFEDAPELGSPADLYSFTASSGDIISVEMRADDDAHLFLFGPQEDGNPLVAEDDLGSAASEAQLAATLVRPGTYTIVAGNNFWLFPPDPDFPGDEGDFVEYLLLVQKCAVSGPVNLSGVPVATEFNPRDCIGFGDLPFRTYAFSGTAGQFVSATVRSDDVDTFARLFAPDGSRVENDDDLFGALGMSARVGRILPADGIYVVEASVSPGEGPVDLGTRPGFTMQATTCPTRAALPGDISAAFEESDCDLGDGRKYDVYSLDGPAGTAVEVASIVPPSTGCVLSLLAEGPQVPGDACQAGLTEIPLASSGRYGFIIAGNDASTRGAYSVQLGRCPVGVVTYGDVHGGELSGSSCADGAGTVAEWFLLRATAGLVWFNEGLSGEVSATFPLAGRLTDLLGGFGFTRSFFGDPEVLFAFDDDLAALVKIAGATPADQGAYTLFVDRAELRQ